MKKLILLLSILFLSCSTTYEGQGLLHPSQLDSVIIVQKDTWSYQTEVIRYYDLKDNKFKRCDFNSIYKDLYQLGDTITQK